MIQFDRSPKNNPQPAKEPGRIANGQEARCNLSLIFSTSNISENPPDGTITRRTRQVAKQKKQESEREGKYQKEIVTHENPHSTESINLPTSAHLSRIISFLISI